MNGGCDGISHFMKWYYRFVEETKTTSCSSKQPSRFPIRTYRVFTMDKTITAAAEATFDLHPQASHVGTLRRNTAAARLQLVPLGGGGHRTPGRFCWERMKHKGWSKMDFDKMHEQWSSWISMFVFGSKWTWTTQKVHDKHSNGLPVHEVTRQSWVKMGLSKHVVYLELSVKGKWMDMAYFQTKLRIKAHRWPGP
jgi:hypothetical protein